jgi:hypothetical protein
MTVIPQQRFQHLTEATIRAVLDRPDRENPIVSEALRLLIEYEREFTADPGRYDYDPAKLRRSQPLAPIQAVVIEQYAALCRARLKSPFRVD